MTLQFARWIDGIPTVQTTAQRDLLYPTPRTEQRVLNVQTGDFERYTGSVWAAIGPSTVAETGVFYVGKHGNDTNDGKSIANAVLTFGEAITLVTAAPDVIVCLDAGIYAEDITVPEGIRLFAPSATLLGVDGAAQVLLLNDGAHITLGNILGAAASNQNGVDTNASTSGDPTFLLVPGRIVTVGTGIGVRITAGGGRHILNIQDGESQNGSFLECDSYQSWCNCTVGFVHQAGGSGRAVEHKDGACYFRAQTIWVKNIGISATGTTNPAGLSIDVDEFAIVAGTIAVQAASPIIPITGKIGRIIEEGGAAVGIDVSNNGRATLIVGEIEATTLYNVPVGSELDLVSARLVGTPGVATGTIKTAIAA